MLTHSIYISLTIGTLQSFLQNHSIRINGVNCSAKSSPPAESPFTQVAA